MATRKPCPGCGKVDTSREPDRVCRVCAHKIAYYESDRQDAEHAARRAEAREAERKGLRGRRVSFAGLNAMTWMPRSANVGSRSPHPATDALCGTTTAMLERVTSPLGDPGYVPGEGVLLLLTDDGYRAVYQFIDALAEALNEAHLLGLSAGQNMLAQLAGGGLTVEQMQDQTEAIRKRAEARRRAS